MSAMAVEVSEGAVPRPQDDDDGDYFQDDLLLMKKVTFLGESVRLNILYCNPTRALAKRAATEMEIAMLIEHLKSEDLNLRVSATRSLSAIAEALGPERVRAELVPFINDSTDDEDEVLLCMAEQLGKLTTYIGGRQYAHELLVPLEQLAAVEESTVREKALDSIQAVARCLSRDQLIGHLVPLVSRLANKEWFTARMSACCLAAPAYASLPSSELPDSPAKRELRELFKKLCQDDTPMVRRVAAHSLGALAKEVELQCVTKDLLELFTGLAEDDQDSVRLQTVDNCSALARVLPPEGQKQHVLPLVLETTEDQSWRVRWSAANKFHEICDALGSEVTNGPLCMAYRKLLQDSEAEVRTAAAMNATKVVRLMDINAVLGKVFPCLQHLVMDTSDHVRQALASVLNDMSPELGRENTINHLLPMLLTLLRDTNPEVRLNIISGLQAVNGVIGVQLLSASLLPAIMELAEDKKWRVRLAIIEHTPVLATQLGAQYFNAQLCEICMTWLGDTVFSIRVAATDNLRHLAEHFGSPWARSYVLPKVEQMHVHRNYLHRMTALYAIQVLTETLDVDMLAKEVLPMVISMTTDPVPNIRFNVSKTLEKMVPRLKVQNDVRAALDNLVNDADRDVRYFARKALQAVAAME